MKKLILIGLLAIGSALISWRSDALTYRQLQAEKLLEISDVAAVVEITSGQVLPCGAGYHGRVEEPIKGAFKKGDDIYFGPYIGTGIGESYLVFLESKPTTQAEYEAENPRIGTISGPAWLEELERKRDAECFAALPPWLEMRGGTATLTIGRPLDFGDREAVLFEEEWNLPPEGTQEKAWEQFDSGIVSEERSWVSVEDVVAALRKKLTTPTR